MCANIGDESAGRQTFADVDYDGRRNQGEREKNFSGDVTCTSC